MLKEVTGGSARSLSFIIGGHWLPQRTGDYSADSERGKECAEELLNLINETQNPAIFGSVMRAISNAGMWDGVEVGFCQRFGVTLLGLVVPTH